MLTYRVDVKASFLMAAPNIIENAKKAMDDGLAYGSVAFEQSSLEWKSMLKDQIKIHLPGAVDHVGAPMEIQLKQISFLES